MLLLEEFSAKLEYHNVLNKSLYDKYTLKSQVKDKLIQIANLFRDDCNISTELVIDYYLVGGNANYNYTHQSDIDIHIIIDFNKINSGTIDLVDYFKSKKELWADNHTITIAGYNVELYVQDINATMPINQGCYSLVQDKFIITPKKVKVDYDDPKLQEKVESFIYKIDNANTILVLSHIKEKLKNLRTIGLHKGGEFSTENLVFKSLRNLGYIEKLQYKYKTLRDKKLSL
jgi:hypothetical protein